MPVWSVGVWWGLACGPIGAFSSVPGARPRLTFAGGVSRLALLGCCRRQLGRSSIAPLRAACGSGVRRLPNSWSPAAVAVSDGSFARLHQRGALIAVVRPRLSEQPEWAPMLIAWVCEWLVRVTCLGGPWLVGDCSGWFPVALSGDGGSRGSGVRIVRMLCWIRATLWCHRQCNLFRSCPAQTPMWVTTYRHRLGHSMVGGGSVALHVG